MKNRYNVWGAAICLLLIACNENETVSEIGHSSISKNYSEDLQDIPYEKVDVLKEFSSDPDILDYNLARKLALLELIGTEMDTEMNWTGCKLNPIPVVLYGFDNKPKFYDFIVLDAEGKTRGTVTAYARKTASTMINGLSEDIKDYASVLSKAGSNSASLFIDWMGDSYVGIRGKSGGIASEVINAETGAVAEQMREVTGNEIVQIMKENVLPELLTKDFSNFDDLEETEANKDFLEEVEAAKTMTLETMTDSLGYSLTTDVKNANAFWQEMGEEIGKVNGMDDEEIVDGSGKGIFGRLFRRIFSRVHRKVSYIPKYAQNRYYNGVSNGTGWCGPWACGYIYYINTGKNKYDYFKDSASSFGELGILNFTLRAFGRPMTPREMARSMPIASGGKIYISPFLWFTDFAAYDQIHHHGKPALSLCAKDGELHWKVAYGTYQSGNYFWRNYYFLQHDNGSKGKDQEAGKKTNYSRVDWWNPWLMVWD